MAPPLQAPCLIIWGFLPCGATLAHAGVSGTHFYGPVEKWGVGDGCC